MATYTYPQSSFPNGDFYLDNFKKEILSSSLSTKFTNTYLSNAVIYVNFTVDLTGEEQTILNNLVTNHNSTIPEQTIKIKEESVETGGYFKFDMFELSCPPNTTTVKTFSFDYPINIVTASLVTEEIHRGDVMTWTVNPNTTIGALGANYTAPAIWTAQNYVINDLVWYKPSGMRYGRTYKCIVNTVSNENPTNTTYWQKQNTTLTVSSTVLQYTKVGFYITLKDGVNTEDVGYVTAINKINSTITVNGSSQYNFLASSPTYFQISIMYMDGVKFHSPMNIAVASAKIGSSYVPAGTTIKTEYTNNSEVDKTLITYIEYLY